jgi:hypothetical protein
LDPDGANPKLLAIGVIVHTLVALKSLLGFFFFLIEYKISECFTCGKDKS